VAPVGGATGRPGLGDWSTTMNAATRTVYAAVSLLCREALSQLAHAGLEWGPVVAGLATASDGLDALLATPPTVTPEEPAHCAALDAAMAASEAARPSPSPATASRPPGRGWWTSAAGSAFGLCVAVPARTW